MSRNFDKAAEFCQIAGTPDLLEYLQLGPDVSAEDAKAALKKRRKYMQGMQSNPKYRKEALFLIKHFSALQGALDDLSAYTTDALRRAESVHLPILEMTVKGVLAGGNLTADQEAYLLRNAIELGVSEATFLELLDRLCREAGVTRPSGAKGTKTATPATAPPMRQPGDDFYTLLGLIRGASLQQIRTAYEQRMSEARARPPSPETEELIVRLDLAWSVLSDPRARETYHITSTRTGPPARRRDAGPPGAQTAPPVRRGATPAGGARPAYSPPGAGSRLEILGDPVLSVTLGSSTSAVSVRIRNGGSEPMSGRITCKEPWVTTHPVQIDPSLQEQDIEVIFDPGGMPGSQATAVIDIVTDRGEHAAITFHVNRSRMPLYVGLGSLAVLALVGALGAATMCQGPVDLEVTIDPWAEEIHFDGEKVGRGHRVVIPAVEPGEHTIEVLQPNFQSTKRSLGPGEIADGRYKIELEQTRKLDFDPEKQKKKKRRTQVPQEEASKVFGERSAGMNGCIQPKVKPGNVLTGSIRVHIDAQGLPAGLEATGKYTDDPDVARCLERQAAALVFAPLTNGDYATVRYEYTVTAPDAK